MFSNTPASKSWMKGEILKKMKDYTTYADEGKKKKLYIMEVFYCKHFLQVLQYTQLN